MGSGRVMIADIIDNEHTTAAAVVALTSDNQVVIARQYRCGPEQIFDEMPGGLVDPGEQPIEAAKRELLEETGYASDSIVPLGSAYLNAWSNTLHYYFLATNCYLAASELLLDRDEEVEVVCISIEQFIANARETKMTDVQGVFLAYNELMKLETR